MTPIADRQVCRVLRPRMILGRKLRPGDTVELTDTERKFLVKHGVVEALPQPKKAKGKDPDGPAV